MREYPLEKLFRDSKIGKIYEGTVLKILDFGAIVSVLPGKDGLLHISQIAQERVNKVEDYLKEGQAVKVKVLEVDLDRLRSVPEHAAPKFRQQRDQGRAAGEGAPGLGAVDEVAVEHRVGLAEGARTAEGIGAFRVTASVISASRLKS